MYEVYGPQGVALLVECLTDNRNRAAMEVRTAVTRNGGTMADPGSVSRLFNRKGVVVVPKSQEGRRSPRTTSSRPPSTPVPRRSSTSARPSRCSPRPTDVVAVRTALQAAGIDYDSAEVRSSPRSTSRSPTPMPPARCSGSIDAVDDLDDVQNVYSNADVPDDVMEAVDA